MSARFTLYRYDLPLVEGKKLPPVFSGNTVRSGLLLELKDDQRLALGEAACLQHQLQHNQASLDECIAAMIKHLPVLKHQAARRPQPGGTEVQPESPFLQFALEMLLDHWHQNETIAVKPEPEGDVELNALLVAGPALSEQIEKAADNGYKTVKVKCGSAPVSTEAPWLTAAFQNAPAGMRIRLDANCAYSYTELTVLHELFNLDSLDYFEEPLADLSDYDLLYHDFPGFRLGIDEHLEATTDDFRAPAAMMKFDNRNYVVKPSTSGYRRLWADKPVTLSSFFESGIGLNYIARHCRAGQAHGLSTFEWFSDDLLKLNSHRGRLNVVSADTATQHLNRELLTTVFEEKW